MKDVLLGIVICLVALLTAKIATWTDPGHRAPGTCVEFPETLCLGPGGWIGEPACKAGVCECAPIKLEDR
jgi:hypothetical protein